MKRLLTVALSAGCIYLATTYSAFAQAQSVQPAQGTEILRTEATTESNTLSKPKAPEMPALQQLQQQTGVFSERQSTQNAKPVKGDPTNKAALEQLAVRFQNDYNAAQVSLLEKGASISGARMVSGHTVVQYKKVTGNEAPLFYITSNLQGAHTISTSKVWPGGLAGLSLAGQGINIGEWDGGAVRTTHQEFGTRVTVMDASPNINDHATHVAATIIGAGTDPLAKGMAYQGALKSYDWTNDESEMATAAAAGMLVSNHSYGLITGWYFGNIEGTGSQWYWFGSGSETEDQNYGRYSEQARDWDLIAANAPNYLAVKAAGNDRNGGPAAGASHRVWNGANWVNSTTTREKAGGVDGYDCISHAGVAKNVLTVGAVEGINGSYSAPTQVISSAFHGWGPTDDGRIKPDLVAKGVAVYSATATSNSSYDSWNGTSMASPTVTGSLALLQQYHKQLYNDAVLKAATLKGIAIHTADEAGDFPGPDYRFGWGLMNTEKATQVIARLAQKHDFKEEVLANGAVNTYAIRSDGTSPLRVTLSWTDVAAAIAPSVLNGTTSALVNNLDVRLIRVSDSAVFSPWVLNPAVPAAAATTGDNNRDNVEQVFLANPGAGDYIVRVSHKGTLGASQAFSLVMSGISPLNVMRNITFRVDMTGLNVSSLGVRIAGNVFNPQWDPSANLMTNVGNGIWSFTASILSGTNVQYKFINGNAWGQDENALPAGCNTGGNRTYTVPNNDDVLPAFLFNQCNVGGGQMVSVTFNVDMTGRAIRPEGMHVAGNFQGWNPGGTPMTLHPTLPNVYTYTTQILEGTEVEYKYVNGNSWGFFDTITNQFVNYSEETPFSCSRFSNRFFTVPNSAITLPLFLFGRCNTAAQTPVLIDFAGGIPAGWTQQGFSGTALTPSANAVFEYRGPSTSPGVDTGSRGGYSGLRLPILSPTAANGFLIFDSDFLDNAGVVGAFGTGAAPSPHLARLTSPTLNLTSVTAPILRFNQFYRKFGSAPGYTTATFVVTSTDGGVTWPDTIQFNTGNVLAQNSATLRDNQQQLLLPSLGGQSNVKIQFLFWGDYYFWMLDDIVLEQSLSNDLALLNASIFNSNTGVVNAYGMVPLFQQQPATFSGVIQNLGATAVPQPGVAVNVFRDSVNVYTEAAFSNGNLGFGASTQINITNPPFVASQTGTYRANFSLLNNTGDSNPGNNQLDRHYFITDTVYALDYGPFGNYVTVGTNNFISNGSRDGMRFANRFSVTGSGMQVSSGFLGVASNSTPGADITFGIVSAADITNPSASPLAFSNTVVLTAQHIADGGVTIGFPGGQFLAPGEYYLVAETYTNAGASVVNVLDDISRPRANDASLIYLPTPALWYNNGIAFVLRMHGTAPASLPNSLATFRVNMSKYPVDTTVGVHVAGNFQGWLPNTSPLTHIGNGIYEASYPVQQGALVQFKFINGNSWGRDEQNWLMDCGVNNLLGSYDRVFQMPMGDTILPAFFFNSCGSTLNELSIADIQYVPEYLLYDSLPNRQSRYKGDTVTVKGVVAGSMTNSALSANFKNGYLQMLLPQQSSGTPLMPSAHTGVNVRLTNLAALADTVNFAAGSYVSIKGVVAEFSNTNLANSETQIDIASTGNISVISLNAPPVRTDLAFIGDFSFINNNLPVQTAFGERFEGSYVRFEDVEVVAINQFATGRFDLTLKDQNNNTIRTRDASRVMRAPYFSDTDSTALIYVQVGDKINIQGFMSELVASGIPAYRINPWYVSDIELVPQSSSCQASLTAQGNTNLCIDQFVTLSVNSTDPIDFVEWYVNGRMISQAGGVNLDARSDGNYSAIVYFVGGCVDTTSAIFVEVTMPHQANVSVNGPLHYQAGQTINTVFSAVPQQQLTLNLQGSALRQLAYRTVTAANGWVNVPQGIAANFNGQLAIARDGSIGDSLACGPVVNASSLQGKIALVFRGACAISDKALNVQTAGAIAVIVVNSLENQFIPNFSANPVNGASITIPVLIVSNEMGLELADLVNSMSAVSLTFAPATSSSYNYTWLMNDLPIAGANGSSYTATMTGDYQLSVSSAAGNCVYNSGYWPVAQSTFTQSPWVLQDLGQPLADQTIRNIEPVSSTVAWALGNKAANTGLAQNFYRTTNGGNSWSAGSIPNTTPLGTSHIMALDDQTAFVTLFGDSLTQGLYKTADGGNSWNRLNVFNNGGFPNFAHFWDQNTGVIVGDPNQNTGAWEIYRTTNGGASWQQVTNAPMAMALDEFGTTAAVSVAPSGQIYWPTVSGRLFKSNDQGLSWMTTNLPAGPGQYNIAFTANGNGAAYHVPSAKLYLTFDDGFSWSLVSRPYGGVSNIASMSYLPNSNNNVLMVSGPLGTAYLENGFNWMNIDGVFHGAVKFIEPSVGWSGGLSANNGQGGVWKWDSNIFGGNMPIGTVSGQVRYANNAQTPMSNTWVIAYDAVDNTMRDAVQTDANGQYFFNGAPQGSYILRAATTKPWGGVNATDALRVARHFTSLQLLNGIRLEAADVNGNSVINSTDALQIAQRFTGLLNNPNFLRIYFDALLGGNLAAASSVHMHSGASVDPNLSWQYVVGDWGNPASPGQMTSGGNGRWSIAMNPTNYYNQAPNGPMPTGSSIDNIGMVFRESGPCGTNVPCLEQKDGQGNDIFLYPWLNPPVSSYLGVKAAMSGPNGFVGGNWMFSEALIQVVAGQNTTADLQAICMGDVDGSYNPGNVRIAPSVHLENDGELVTSTGKLVKMPIRIETGTQLGAMSLVMQYNPSQMQPVALKLTDAQHQAQAQVNITEGNISLAWYDLSGWVVTNDQVIMELEAYIFTESVDQIDLAVGEGSEFADESATPLNNTKLLMPGIRSTSSSVTNVLSLSNYPNPFRHETTVAFELPEASKVKMIVNDVTGRAITELDLGELSAGKHTQLFEGSALSAGVYFCEMHVQGESRQEMAVIRMIIK